MAKLSSQAMTKLISLGAQGDIDNMMPVFLETHAGGAVRTESWDGRQWFVVQTIAAISQVMNGELLPAEELSLFVEAWNGRPVPVRHPQIDGLHVSANSPQILSDFNVGYFFNARAENHELGVKLVGEMWLDEARINEFDGDAQAALETLKSGGSVEVSTAYFCLIQDASGEFDGIAYNGVQHSIKPDHIALLPDQIGACSIKDGCGAGRVNAEEGEEETEEITANALPDDQGAMVGVWLQPQAASILGVEEADKPRMDTVDDLHISLAVLGRGDQVTIGQQELAGIVDYVARSFYTHSVAISGSFRFYGEDGYGDGDALGYLVEGETLQQMRRALVSELDWEGQSVSRKNNYIPHVTIGYASDARISVPAPGIDRFVVSAITLVYGEERVTFSLRGEMGEDYLPLNQIEEIEDMADQENVVEIEMNEDIVEDTTAEDVQADADLELTELTQFMEEIKAAGGLAAIIEAAQAVKANEDAQRVGAIERVKSVTTVYDDERLGAMATNDLVDLADALTSVKANGTPAANYSANAGGGTVKPDDKDMIIEGLGKVRPYSVE